MRIENLGGGVVVCTDVGHTVGTDAILLASFAAPKRVETACDLGCGSGVIPLLWFAGEPPPKKAYGLELQPHAARLARLSVEKSGLGGRLNILECDLRELPPDLPRGGFDLLTCNPPYNAVGAGVMSARDNDKIARHETACSLDDVCAAAAKLLRFGGRLCVCYLPERLADLLGAMRTHRIEPKRLRFIHKNADSPPWLVLAEGKLGSKPFMQVDPPVFLDSGDALTRFGEHKLEGAAEKKAADTLPGGMLYLVGTPIGNLGDMSPRVAKTLAQVDFVAAEDTRVTLRLLNHLGIKKQLVSYHEHNRNASGDKILARLLAGESCALCSDAGMPCISDPGQDLVELCAQRGVEVIAIPGPTALATALSLSGLPGGRFAFEGFLSIKKGSRESHLAALKDEMRTMIFYEAPHKLAATLRDMLRMLGDRRIALCRELTKLHEEAVRTTLSQAVADCERRPPRGEYVLVVEGAPPPPKQAPDHDAAMALVRELRAQGLSLSDAAKAAAKQTGCKKSELYASALREDEQEYHED